MIRGRRSGVVVAHLLRVVGAALVAAGVLATGAAAATAFTRLAETGTPGILTLAWGDTPRFIDEVVPGQSYHWQIRADLDGADASAFTLTLRADGALVRHPQGLRIALTRCDSPFGPLSGTPTCAGTAESILAPTPVADVAAAEAGDTWLLPPLTVRRPQYILATVSTPAAAAGDPTWYGTDARVGFGFTVSGESPTADPRPELALTGADLVGPVLVGAGLVGLGLAALVVARGRRRATA